MASGQSPHNYQRKAPPQEDEDEDPVDKMLKQTGCAELHYSLQECMSEYKDWRKCQDLVQEFKKCMTTYEVKRQALRSGNN
jgi:cytochrome c oxidase assembly factor 4